MVCLDSFCNPPPGVDAAADNVLGFAGLVHRDVKPDNILIHEGKVQLIDFGLADVDPGPEGFKEVVGTVPFSAPEVLQRSGAGSPADIWAAGVVFYVVATGRLPFDGALVDAECPAPTWSTSNLLYGGCKPSVACQTVLSPTCAPSYANLCILCNRPNRPNSFIELLSHCMPCVTRLAAVLGRHQHGR